MMHISVFTVDGGHLEIDRMPREAALDIREEFAAGEGILVFELDGSDTVLIAARHVVRIDFDEVKDEDEG